MKEVQLVCGRQADNKARGFFVVLTAAVFSVAVLAGNAFSQEVDAQIPISVNVDANVWIDPPAGGGTGSNGNVTGGAQQTFDIKLAEQPVSVSHRPQKQARTGAWVSHNRGNVTLNLHPEQYQNAAVSLHSVNGKRILNGKTSATKGTRNISRANIPAGVYLLSVKGTKGNNFTTKLTHSGNMLNINVAFGGADNPSLSKSAADNTNYGEWTITVFATGYGAQTRKFTPTEGLNTLQSFTLTAGGDTKYTLTVNRNITEGGRVFVENAVSTGTTLHNADAQVAVRVEPTLGYKFTGWSGASTSANTSITANMRISLTLTANFEYVGTHTLTINKSPAEGGKVFVNNIESAGVTAHTAGTSVVIKARASEGYFFSAWSGAYTSTDTTLRHTMNSELALSAIFKEDNFIDSRDGKKYRIVEIGDQTWMAENLNFSAHSSGDSRCYINAPDSCTKYGRLYDWYAALSACPTGWQLPHYDDWNTLARYVGGYLYVDQYGRNQWLGAGKKLKSRTGWRDYNNASGNGTNEFGFSALPAGDGGVSSFNGVGNRGAWWSATTIEDTERLVRLEIAYSDDGLYWFSSSKDQLYSVRCLKYD